MVGRPQLFSRRVRSLVFGFLVWRKREQLARVPVTPSWGGLPVLIAGLGLLIIGVYGADLFMSRFSLLLVLAGIVIYCAGWTFFRAVLFPWALLILMIPLPAIVFNQLTFPLQLLASKLASELLPSLQRPRSARRQRHQPALNASRSR